VIKQAAGQIRSVQQLHVAFGRKSLKKKELSSETFFVTE
jgi:hypothetical protein